MPTSCSLMPKEKKKNVLSEKPKFSISVLKENKEIETRAALTPLGISVLSACGISITVEAGIGEQAGYEDSQYSKQGAKVTPSREELFKSDVILKVSPLNSDEIKHLKKDQTVISCLGIAQAKKENIEAIMSKGAVAIALEYIQTDTDFYPINFINSEIAGKNAIFIAAEYLGKQSGGKGVFLGGITGISPTSVVILGTSAAALFAAKTALSLGAEVKVFDASVYKLSKFTKELGREIFTSVLQPQVLSKALLSADVIIGAKCIKSQPYPIITEEMVSTMKKGSVIIDLNIETGSCFETSRPTSIKTPAFKYKGITHYCLPNITSLVPRTASIALSNVLYPLINDIYTRGGIYQEIKYNRLIRPSVYCYNGFLTNAFLSKKFSIKYKDIDLYLI